MINNYNDYWEFNNSPKIILLLHVLIPPAAPLTSSIPHAAFSCRQKKGKQDGLPLFA